MGALRTFWQESLAALVITAWLISPLSSRAAEEEKARPDAPAARAQGERPGPGGPPGERAERERPRREAAEARQREGRARLDAMLQVREQLRRAAEGLERKLEGIQAPEEVARRLRQELEEARRKIRDIEEQIQQAQRRREGDARPGPDAQPVPPEERERAERRLHELENHLRELKQSGKHDEAERVKRELEEVRARLAGPRDRPQQHLSPEAREQLERRVH